MTNRYDLVTETTGIEVTTEAASMMSTRYELAAREAAGKRALEIGCGAGLGFGLIGRSARLLVGGDYSAELLASGKKHYGSRFPLARLSADRLPFKDGCFDVVFCFEMTYYLPDLAAAVREIARVLGPGGKLVIVNANPQRPDFIRSPYSTHYHSSDELRTLLEQAGFVVKVEAAFTLETGGGGGLVSRALMLARKTLEALRLVPRTIEGRARLKRLIFRGLRPLPPELPANFAPEAPLSPVSSGPLATHKVIYVTATKR